MKFGFIIDNRKCIGCHACTVACKSEHDVPVGVNRTWVKQTEKGSFPSTRRIFSVLRCNHCSDAPCVEICPTEALHIREDGIVDFNNDRCIGCKSCMQACPYDALYIDPQTNTAAKCNYCAHRVDVGLEPACVNVCPEHAIISGDMDDPQSEISQLLAREQVTVRKPEKATNPNLFYIEGDEASLNPSLTERDSEYFWNSQVSGVGHYAKYAEKRTDAKDLLEMVGTLSGKEATYAGSGASSGKKSIEVIMENAKAKRIYDTPDKGILWGWEVNAYVLTKAIAAGAILVPLLYLIMGNEVPLVSKWISVTGGLVFLGLTGLLLIMDLDQPRRFAYVLLRPQWKSWLVKGGYSITVFGGLVTLLGVAIYFSLNALIYPVYLISGVFAVVVAIYTAFLFAQAKGRDFWQSPALAFHMLAHSVMAGTALFAIGGLFTNADSGWNSFISLVMIVAVSVNLFIVLIELSITHPTQDAKRVVKMILSGRYKTSFWVGSILIGNIMPLVLAVLGGSMLQLLAGLFILLGIYITEKIWVEAPQRIPLT